MVSPSRERGLPSISCTLFLILAQAILPASAATCSGYTATGPSGNHTFNNYAMYDFRQLGDQLSGTPVYADDPDFPNGQFALATSTYFNSSDWAEPWSTLATKKVHNTTQKTFVDMVYTPLNVAIVKDNSTDPDGATVLSLTTNRLEKYSATAQIQTNQKFLHASVRMSARMLGPAGACGAFFIYGDDNNESDVELLTNDTSSLFHATNHPSQDSKGQIINGATNIVSIPENGTTPGQQNSTWSEWTEWRMDWLADRTQWIVNGELVVDKTYSPPKIDSFLGISMWSNGGTWTGNMTVGDTATLQVRWIEIAYNTTNDQGKSDAQPCTIDTNNGGSNKVSWASPRVSASLMAWSAILATSTWLLS